MALLTLPANATFTRRAWTTPQRNQINRSAWTGARTVMRLPGAGFWKVSAAVLPMVRESEVRPWRAFFAALEGPANTFLMPAACSQTPVVSSLVDVAGALGGTTSAPLKGLGAAGLKLQGGQYMTFTLPSGNLQMVLLTQDLVADGAGLGVANFRGALREDVVNNGVVEITDPVCEMSLVGAPAWDESEGVYRFAIDAEEVF